MDHQYQQNGALMLNALKINQKHISYPLFHRAIDGTLKIPENCWPFRYLNLQEYCSSALSAHAYKMVITTIGVQIDNCFSNT